MNALDIALIVLLVVPALIGLFKGLVNVAVAFLGLWLGFVVAGLFAPALAVPLASWLGEGRLTGVVAYGALFALTLVATGLCGWLVTRSLKALDLQWVNRLAGLVLGVACGVLLGGVLVGGWRSVRPESEVLTGSVLAAPLAAVTSFVIAIPEKLEGGGPAAEAHPSEAVAPTEPGAEATPAGAAEH